MRHGWKALTTGRNRRRGTGVAVETHSTLSLVSLGSCTISHRGQPGGDDLRKWKIGWLRTPGDVQIGRAPHPPANALYTLS